MPCDGVFHHDAAVRLDAEAAGGKLKNLRVRLAAGYVFASDDGRKLLAPAEFFQAQRDVFRWAGGADGQQEAVGCEGIDQFESAVHRGKFLAKRIAEERFLPFVELANSLVGQLVAKAAEENVATRAAEVERRIRTLNRAGSALRTICDQPTKCAW